MTADRASLTTVLALDSAGSGCSAALWHAGTVIASRFEAMRRGHAERLVPMIDAVMDEGAVRYRDLDRIAVTLGPGGFTGVRIGLATARGLALASGRPLVGVSSFKVLAAAAQAEAAADATLVVAIDAKRKDVYVQGFRHDLQERTEPLSVLPEALPGILPDGPLVLVGDGVPQIASHLAAANRQFTLSEAPGLVDAARLAELVARGRPEAEQGTSGDEPLEPLYLRPPDVSPASGGPR